MPQLSAPSMPVSKQAIPDGYKITAATRDDVAALIAVDKAASKLFEPTGLLGPEALEDHVPAAILEQEIPKNNVFVARNQHDWPVGFVLIRPRGTGLYLDQVSVHPDHGQKGLGRLLVLSALDQATARKLPHITLSTFRDLPWNGPFYKSLGFKEMPRKRYEPYMLEIEDAQRLVMDVTQRCFMRIKAPRRRLRFGELKKEKPV